MQILEKLIIDQVFEHFSNSIGNKCSLDFGESYANKLKQKKQILSKFKCHVFMHDFNDK